VITEDLRNLESSGFSRPSNAWIVLMSPVGAMEMLPQHDSGQGTIFAATVRFAFRRRSARSSAKMDGVDQITNMHAVDVGERKRRGDGSCRSCATEVFRCVAHGSARPLH